MKWSLLLIAVAAFAQQTPAPPELTPAEKQKVFMWLGHLANWENDQATRDASKPSVYENVFVLTTSDDIRISFSLDNEKHEITVLDLSKPSRFETASHLAQGS